MCRSWLVGERSSIRFRIRTTLMRVNARAMRGDGGCFKASHRGAPQDSLAPDPMADVHARVIDRRAAISRRAAPTDPECGRHEPGRRTSNAATRAPRRPVQAIAPNIAQPLSAPAAISPIRQKPDRILPSGLEFEMI
ncbi:MULTISPECIES: hypothetical protein [Burkholderia]|uniref:hypothetical protein n=1 Tax=Burkholderia TaxID=32008 RepID=UPI0015C5D0DB|nr:MULTISPECIES: hypothetical protein [Burkholderia]MBN3842588.1 hypothetical protein [Burkholderia sp. Ac-20349]